MRVLIIAPHPDDEILGCGGLIAKYLAEGHEVFVGIVTKETEPLFTEEQDTLIRKVQPEEVYIPHRGDMHLDHKMVVDACMVALRPRFDYTVKRIYAYETLSETEWDIPNTTNAFIPNVYVDITKYIDKKTAAMAEVKSQVCAFPNPRSIEAIRALAMLRGSTISREYAEAFMLIRDIK